MMPGMERMNGYGSGFGAAEGNEISSDFYSNRIVERGNKPEPDPASGQASHLDKLQGYVFVLNFINDGGIPNFKLGQSHTIFI